jgi:hypothetical protein
MLKVAHIHMIHAQLPKHQSVMVNKKAMGNEKNTFQDLLSQAMDKNTKK